MFRKSIFEWEEPHEYKQVRKRKEMKEIRDFAMPKEILRKGIIAILPVVIFIVCNVCFFPQIHFERFELAVVCAIFIYPFLLCLASFQTLLEKKHYKVTDKYIAILGSQQPSIILFKEICNANIVTEDSVRKLKFIYSNKDFELPFPDDFDLEAIVKYLREQHYVRIEDFRKK